MELSDHIDGTLQPLNINEIPLDLSGIDLSGCYEGVRVSALSRLSATGPDSFRESLLKQSGFPLTREQVIERTKRALKFGIPDISMLRKFTTPDTEAVICGGGPSIVDYVETIRDLQDRGLRVFSVNKTHDFLLEHGIKPWAHIILDSNQWVSTYVKSPQRGVRYLIAGQCHDDTFNALEGYSRYLWHAGIGDSETEIIEPLNYLQRNHKNGDWTVLPGGTTVGIRAPLVAYATCGAYRVHMIGMDSSHRRGKAHGYEKQNYHNLESGYVRFSNKSGHAVNFETNAHMGRQALDFEEMVENQLPQMVRAKTAPPFQFKFYGDGLLPTLAACYGWNADPEMNRKWTTPYDLHNQSRKLIPELKHLPLTADAL